MVCSMVLRACKLCKRLLRSETCPVCKSDKLVDNWKGKITVLDPIKSFLAKKLGLTEPGEYALRL